MRNDARVTEYRERATQLRGEADGLSDPESKKSLLEIAERYDRLAKCIEAKNGEQISN